jgi:hypothetical protein
LRRIDAQVRGQKDVWVCENCVGMVLQWCKCDVSVMLV